MGERAAFVPGGDLPFARSGKMRHESGSMVAPGIARVIPTATRSPPGAEWEVRRHVAGVLLVGEVKEWNCVNSATSWR